jgi:hypothetical protein
MSVEALVDEIMERIEDAIAFLKGGPCPECHLGPAQRIGESVLMDMDRRPLVQYCEFCCSVPAGSPTEADR